VRCKKKQDYFAQNSRIREFKNSRRINDLAPSFAAHNSSRRTASRNGGAHFAEAPTLPTESSVSNK
jgi:hypothetical protein